MAALKDAPDLACCAGALPCQQLQIAKCHINLNAAVAALVHTEAWHGTGPSPTSLDASPGAQVVRSMRQGHGAGQAVVDTGAMCLPGLSDKVAALVQDARSKGAQVPAPAWVV